MRPKNTALVIPLPKRPRKPMFSLLKGAPKIEPRADKLRGHKSRTYLYVIHCEGFYKVGLSRDPTLRMADLQSCCPFPISIVAHRGIEGKPIHYERLIHAMIREHRVHGEWFQAPLEMIQEAVEITCEILRDDRRMEELLDGWAVTAARHTPKPKNVGNDLVADIMRRHAERHTPPVRSDQYARNA